MPFLRSPGAKGKDRGRIPPLLHPYGLDTLMTTSPPTASTTVAPSVLHFVEINRAARYDATVADPPTFIAALRDAVQSGQDIGREHVAALLYRPSFELEALSLIAPTLSAAQAKEIVLLAVEGGYGQIVLRNGGRDVRAVLGQIDIYLSVAQMAAMAPALGSQVGYLSQELANVSLEGRSVTVEGALIEMRNLATKASLDLDLQPFDRAAAHLTAVRSKEVSRSLGLSQTTKL